jgi:hypothetical protein
MPKLWIVSKGTPTRSALVVVGALSHCLLLLLLLLLLC